MGSIIIIGGGHNALVCAFYLATAGAIRAFSSADAAKYPEFCAALRTLGHFLSGLFNMTPPSIDTPSTSEMWELLKTGRRFRSLGKRDGYRLLRWGPMAVAD